MTHILRLSLLLALLLMLPAELRSEPAPSGMECRGKGGAHACARPGSEGGSTCCGGGAAGERADTSDGRSDQELFHWLVDRRDSIRREVRETATGVLTVTESDDAEVAAGIREHVAAMHRRLLEGRPIHRRDPLFAAIFDNREKIELRISETDHGVRVEEVSDDPWVAKLIQAHARVVSGFLAHGRAEMRTDHEVPPRP